MQGVIKDRYWLKNVTPAMLFSFLKRIDRSEVFLTKCDQVSGWLIFVEMIVPNERKLLAIFYKKGDFLVFYKGRLKKDRYLGWILIDELSEILDPLVMEFRNQVISGLFDKV